MVRVLDDSAWNSFSVVKARFEPVDDLCGDLWLCVWVYAVRYEFESLLMC